MPGVVAGFPRRAGIDLTSARFGGSMEPGLLDVFGYRVGLGGISPAGASGIPNAAPSLGAAGEILEFIYERHSSAPAHRLFVVLRGAYASVPFASVAVDGIAIAGWAVFYQEATQTYFRTTSISANPIPAGAHTLIFS